MKNKDNIYKVDNNNKNKYNLQNTINHHEILNKIIIFHKNQNNKLNLGSFNYLKIFV